MQGTALLQLSDPDVMKLAPAAFQPAADTVQKLGHVAGLEAVHIPIGEGQHGRAVAQRPEGVLDEGGRPGQGSTHPGEPGFCLVDLDRVGCERVTCFKFDKPRGAPGAGRACRRCRRAGGFWSLGKQKRRLHVSQYKGNMKSLQGDLKTPYSNCFRTSLGIDLSSPETAFQKLETVLAAR